MASDRTFAARWGLAGGCQRQGGFELIFVVKLLLNTSTSLWSNFQLTSNHFFFFF